MLHASEQYALQSNTAELHKGTKIEDGARRISGAACVLPLLLHYFSLSLSLSLTLTGVNQLAFDNVQLHVDCLL